MEISLTPFTEIEFNSDIYRKWFHDLEVTKYNSHGLFPYTEEKKKSFMKSIEENNRVVFAIYTTNLTSFNSSYNTQKIHVGNISLQSINWVYHSAEIAWVIGEKNYWNKGIATQAGRMILEHAFNKLNLHRIWSGTSSTNKSMKKVFKKLGFLLEGFFREGMFLDGEYVDIWNYYITRDIWEKQLENIIK